MSLTPRVWAWWYGRAPAKLGRNEWWMLIARPASASQTRGLSTCMYRASTTSSTSSTSTRRSSSSSAASLEAGSPGATGHVRERHLVEAGQPREVVVVADHGDGLDGQPPGPVAVQQVVEAVPRTAHHDQGADGGVQRVQLPVEVELRGRPAQRRVEPVRGPRRT